RLKTLSSFLVLVDPSDPALVHVTARVADSDSRPRHRHRVEHVQPFRPALEPFAPAAGPIIAPWSPSGRSSAQSSSRHVRGSVHQARIDPLAASKTGDRFHATSDNSFA